MISRVLIVATRQIGDVLCTTPLMHRARRIWPDAVIDVLGYEKTMGMLVGNPDINAVIESPEHPRWADYKKLIRKIFRRYDLAVVTQPSDRAHVYGLLAAPERVGIVPNKKSHNWWKKLFSSRTVELDYWNQHVVIERLRLLDNFAPAQLSLNSVAEWQSISLVPPASEPLPQDLFEFVSTGLIVIVHATPMWRFKRWPIEHWADLLQTMVCAGCKVILTGSASPQDTALNADILAKLIRRHPEADLSQIRNCAGLLSLGQVTSLMNLARFYVGVDTSITHLAAACRVPTITLFGATAPPNFGPWAKATSIGPGTLSIWDLRGSERLSDGSSLQVRGNVSIIQGPGECVPCRKAGCDNHFDSRSQCLDELSPQVVSEVFKRMRLS
jgi:heptosyltransferase-3